MLKKGDIVKYISATTNQVQWGNNSDPRGILIEFDLYELESVETYNYNAKLKLVGIFGQLNSAHFEKY